MYKTNVAKLWCTPYSKPKPLALPALPPKGVDGKSTLEQFSQTTPLRSFEATLLWVALLVYYGLICFIHCL